MFEYYLKDRELAENVDLECLSKQVTGFTGADISAVCNEAGLIALMNDKTCIDMDSLEEAVDKRLFKGNRSKGDKNATDIEIVAYHESGHAVMNYLLGHEITRASIQANTSGVGGVVFGADKDSQFTTDKELRERVMIAYAGRVSEELKFGVVTQGAVSDISQATNILMAYVEKYGFDKDFGLLDIEALSSKHLIESDVIIGKLSDMSKSLYTDTKHLLAKNIALVECLAKNLLEYETLSGTEIYKLLEKEKEKVVEV
jgi:cell division protease FtsH